MNVMKSFFVIVALVTALISQSSAVTGRAVNAQREPLGGVEVTLISKTLTATTGEDGLFDLSISTTVLRPQLKRFEPFANNNTQYSAYNLGGWNTVKVRIEGDPPLYNFWINGLHTVKYKADKKWTTATQGKIGFQVINNSRRWPQDSKGRVKYKNIRVREF